MVQILKTAVENKMKPTAVLFQKSDPYGDWESLDYKLLQAYQTLKDETCKECGNPLWLCRSTDNMIGWSVDTTTCYASQAIEARRFKDDNGGKTPEKKDSGKWGKTYFARPKPVINNGTLPTRKDFYQKDTS